MLTPLPTDPDEIARLAALHAYHVLDTAPEKEFDDLVQLASLVCGTPIAMISLVDESRQWFKAKKGLDGINETPREVSFCRYTIERPEVMVVPDALRDDRFVDNPLVTGEPHIRFYAGAPLITPGNHRIGSICVVDDKAGELTAIQREALQAISRQVVAQLELRWALSRHAETIEQRDMALFRSERVNFELELRNARHQAMLSVLSEGIIVQSLEGGIESFNPGACRILGLEPGQMTGRDSIDPRWAAVYEDGTPFPGEKHPAMMTLRTGMPCSNVIMGLRLPDLEPRWISINTCLLPKADPDEPNKAVVSFHEITELLRVQHELGAARDAADLANRAKSRFLATISHEIRTPLTAILGFTDRLNESTITDRDRNDCVQTIQRNSAHLMNVVDDILDFTKIEAGKPTVERIPVQPAKEMEDIGNLPPDELPKLNGRILLAEDGPDNQRLFAHFLRSAGAEVVVAENGWIACDLAMASLRENVPFDLILMDMQMPLMDGYTAARTLRANGWTRPIIPLTAHSFDEERENCLKAGCNGFLSKPISRANLLRFVHTTILTRDQTPTVIHSTLEHDPIMADLLETYIAELPKLVDDIESLTTANDLNGLRLVAHRLRGSGGSYGFPQISAAAKKLEEAVTTNQDLGTLSTTVHELTAVLRHVRCRAHPIIMSDRAHLSIST